MKKKILTVVCVLSMMVAGCTTAGKIADMGPDTYQKGTVTENTFESEWIGLRFNPPATVIMATQEEMDAIMLQGLQTMYGEDAAEMFDYATMTTVNEMQATWLIGSPLVQVAVEKMPVEGVTEEDYLKVMANNLEAMPESSGIIYTVDDTIYDMQIGGLEFKGMTVTLNISGNDAYQKCFVKKKENRMILITFVYVEETEQYLQEAMDAFTAY